MDDSATENIESGSLLNTEINQHESLKADVITKKHKHAEIIESLLEQIRKRNLLKNKNCSLQQKLAIFIPGSSEKDYFSNFNISEEADEWTFRKLLNNIALRENELNDTSKKYLTEIQLLKEEISKKREEFTELTLSFKQETEKAALKAVHSETGEHLSAKDVQVLLAREEEVSKTLHEYQSYSVQKRQYLNSAMKKKKNLAEGPLDFAKYEIMCIETQNMKEIIQPLSEMRDQLFKERMTYTKMKRESKELQHKFVLLQHPKLIEDYNKVQQENEADQEELQRLKKTYEDEIKILNTKFMPEI